MTDSTKDYLAVILGALKPTTLAAIAADLDEGCTSIERPFYEMVMEQGVTLVGENDFELMIGQAYDYVG